MKSSARQARLCLIVIFGVGVLSGCAPSVGPGEAASNESAPATHGGNVVRPVSHEDFPAVLESCLEDSGFSSTRVASDGSLEYGPFTPTQEEDFLRADQACRAQYPLEYDYARDATTEDWIRVYEHQRDVWLPCMHESFDVQVGQIPSQEAFIANPRWIDEARFNEALQSAVEDDLLDNENGWIEHCPDFPPTPPSS